MRASASVIGKSPARQPRSGVGFRQVRRHRVVDQRVDARLAELRLQPVAPRLADDEQVPDRLRPVGHERQRQVRKSANASR